MALGAPGRDKPIAAEVVDDADPAAADVGGLAPFEQTADELEERIALLMDELDIEQERSTTRAG